MRIRNARELGVYIRERRRVLGLTQAQAAAEAHVSQRWLASVEAGKATTEIGLIFNTLHALRLTMDIEPTKPPPPGAIDLDELLRSLGPES